MAEGVEVLDKKPYDEHRAHFEEWLVSTYSNPDNFGPQALEMYLDFISGPIGQPHRIRHLVAHYDTKHNRETSDHLDELGAVPVQLIWRADDAWQVIDWAHKLNRVIPGSALYIIETCGHFAPEERPQEVAAALLDLLGQHTASRPAQLVRSVSSSSQWVV